MREVTIAITLSFLFISTFSQSCLPEGIHFDIQAQVDSFQINYPGCTVIEGNVYISGDYINNLNGLNVLTGIGGNLKPYGGVSLQNLTGLENLTYINGYLSFDHSGLTNLNGLEGLTSIGGGLYFNAEYALQDITALANLTSIGGSLVIGTQGTASGGGTTLINLEGLEGLDSIHGGLGITSNGLLTDISALGGLDYIGGNILIRFNSSLASCQSEGLCNYLLNPNGSVSIYNNAPGCNSVVDFGAMCNDTIPCLPYGNYIFIAQTDIDNFQNVFPGCTELEGHLTIAVCGPEGKGSPYSGSGSTISNLDGLSVITSIGGELFIYYNDSLESLSGIDNIDENSITALSIIHNQVLSICEVQSVCNYLVLSGSQVYINANAPGCNTKPQVQIACASVMVDEQYLQENIRIYPNPAHQELNITLEGYTIDEVSVYTLTGQQVMQERPANGIIDISYLQPGMYIVEVIIENTKVRQKLLVQR